MDPRNTDATLARVVREGLAPLVSADGGTIEWVGKEGSVAIVRLSGACAGCPGRTFTVQDIVLPALRAADPTIVSVRVDPGL